jgi:hypothetical protein
MSVLCTKAMSYKTPKQLGRDISYSTIAFMKASGASA